MVKIVDKKLLKRDVLPSLEKELSREGILTLVGSRQVGKTSLMALLYQAIGKAPKVYFDLEDIDLLAEFNNLKFDDFPAYLKEKKDLSLNKKTYVFIDEIQYLDNPSSFLKYVADHYSKIKFIVSGSSTLEIKKKFSDRLTGRKSLYQIKTLSFDEFLFFQKKDFKIRKDLNLQKLIAAKKTVSQSEKQRVNWQSKELGKAFEEFVLYGGYPKGVLSQSKSQKIDILKEIHSSYIKKDIRDLAEIEEIGIYNNLIEVLASQAGGLLNIDELTNTLGAHRKTIEKYLFLLENTFIIQLLRPFYTNKRKEITKMSKVYLKDTGLRNMLIKNFNSLETRPDKGALVENFVFCQVYKKLEPLSDLYFWRTQTKAEVDFVIKGKEQKLIPIEVKYRKAKKPVVPSGLRSFIEKHQPAKAFVITQDLFSQIKVNKTKIYFLPAFLV